MHREGCPTIETIQEGTAYYLGVEGIEDPRDDLSAQATITAVEGGFHLELRLSSPLSLDESETEAPSCEVLADIVALKFALALDPRTVVEETPPEAPTEPAEDPQPATRRQSPKRTADPRRRPSKSPVAF